MDIVLSWDQIARLLVMGTGIIVLPLIGFWAFIKFIVNMPPTASEPESPSRPDCHLCGEILTRITALPIDDAGEPTIPPGAVWVCNEHEPPIYFRSMDPSPEDAGKPVVAIDPLDV